MDRVTSLPPNCIFVFGSNEQGVHGRGAALDARMYFGAILGKGEGLHGQSYAIPTCQNIAGKVSPISLGAIQKYVDAFKEFASSNPQYIFILTPIGTGLAGFTSKEIGPMFKNSSENIVIPLEFRQYG